ncbi:MAG: DinB family protein [Planctomycetota bacterium]
MNSIELLKHSTELSTFAFRSLAEDLVDQPLTRVSPRGNHAMWCVGHMALSDGMMVAALTQGENPFQHWDSVFNSGAPLSDDDADYPSYADVLDAFDQNRRVIVAGLDALTEADLGRPNPQAPEGFEEFFGTLGKVAASVPLHTMHHRGQLADIRRALSREPMMA